MEFTPQISNWLRSLPNSLDGFLHSLKTPDQPGKFLPCLRGTTPAGNDIELGFSCFALRLYHTLGLWETLSLEEQTAWIEHIQSFQVDEAAANADEDRGAFIDPALFRHWSRQRSWRRRIRSMLIHTADRDHRRLTTLAETKQAITTLADVGAQPRHTHRGILANPKAAIAMLRQQNWSQPWGAGAQFANVCALLATQGPKFLSKDQISELHQDLRSLIDSVLAPATGAYVRGDFQDSGNLINGAMKVLTGMKWVDFEIHHPERLIDTCLAHPPAAEGCHLVDHVYVLYRCAAVTDHRRDEIAAQCVETLNQIQRHWIEEDGGFSYWLDRSQTHYYGVKISEGKCTADIHGTVLLVWAISMILRTLGEHRLNWNLIKP